MRRTCSSRNTHIPASEGRSPRQLCSFVTSGRPGVHKRDRDYLMCTDAAWLIRASCCSPSLQASLPCLHRWRSPRLQLHGWCSADQLPRLILTHAPHTPLRPTFDFAMMSLHTVRADRQAVQSAIAAGVLVQTAVATVPWAAAVHRLLCTLQIPSTRLVSAPRLHTSRRVARCSPVRAAGEQDKQRLDFKPNTRSVPSCPDAARGLYNAAALQPACRESDRMLLSHLCRALGTLTRTRLVRPTSSPLRCAALSSGSQCSSHSLDERLRTAADRYQQLTTT